MLDTQTNKLEMFVEKSAKDAEGRLESVFRRYAQDIKNDIKAHLAETKSHMTILGEAYQERVSTIIEYFGGRMDRLETKIDKVEETTESIKSDIVDIKYDVRVGTASALKTN